MNNKNYNSYGGSIILKRSLDILENIMKNDGFLHFLNLYNGVKIECFGQILSIENDIVVCKTTLLQILAIKEERNAFIVKDENFSENLKADIVSVDISNSTVALKNFIYMPNLHANLRKYQRVHPNRYTRVVLRQNNFEVKGNLYDISEGGLGIVSTECAPFDKKNPIMAEFDLEINSSKDILSIGIELKLIADLVYRGAVRYCCQIIAGQSIQVDIAKFSNERVRDTIKELQSQID